MLAQMVQHNPSLTKLDLSGKHIEETGVLALDHSVNLQCFALGKDWAEAMQPKWERHRIKH